MAESVCQPVAWRGSMRRMAASTSSPPAVKTSRRGWRYSLRALLIFFTLVCVGVWYWYRVPYGVEILHSEPKFLFYEKPDVVEAAKEFRHYRRLLRGDSIREGTTEYFDDQGRRIGRENWREGKLHGRSLRWYPSGNLREQGDYRLGAKTGVWELFDTSENLVLRTLYDQNWRHGDAQWFEDGNLIRTVRYDRGEVTQIDGRNVIDPMGRALREGRIDHEHIADLLGVPGADHPNIRLDEIAYFIGESYKVPVYLDRRAIGQAKIRNASPITLNADRIDAQLMLVMICDPHGLAATYRFGMIWITTKESARNWVDQTGVSQLLNSPPRGATPDDFEKMRRLLNYPTSFDFVDTPAQEAVQFLIDNYREPFDFDESVKEAPLTIRLSGVNLKNGLAVLCDQHNLRIRWKEGTTLMIEPQNPIEESQARRADRQ